MTCPRFLHLKHRISNLSPPSCTPAPGFGFSKPGVRELLRSCHRSNLPGSGCHTLSGLTGSIHRITLPRISIQGALSQRHPKASSHEVFQCSRLYPCGEETRGPNGTQKHMHNLPAPLARATSSGLPKLPTFAETAMLRQPVRRHPLCETYHGRKGGGVIRGITSLSSDGSQPETAPASSIFATEA